MRRLAAWIIGAAACAIVASSAARAQDYPTRPIRVIVGFGAGSGADVTARVVGARMSEILGQQIVIENKPGAGSSIARRLRRARRATTATRCSWPPSRSRSTPR